MPTQTPTIPPAVAGPGDTFYSTGITSTKNLPNNPESYEGTYKWQWIPDGPNDVAVAKYATHKYRIVNGPVTVTGSPSNLGFATASFSTLESGNVDVNAQGPNGYDGLAPTDPLEDHYILYPGPTGITSVKVGVQSDISGTAYMGRSGSLIFNFGGMQIEDEGVTITP